MEEKRPWYRKKSALGVAAVAVAAIAAVAVPLPYVIESPGPTFNVLEKQGDKKVISVSGATTYPTSGSLRMVTVSMRGGPGANVSLAELVAAYLRGHSQITPEEEVFPKNVTREQIEQAAAAQMQGSQQNAEAAALAELGYKVPAIFEIMHVAKGTDADGKLKKGDKILRISEGGNSVTTDTAGSLFAFLKKVPPKKVVTVKMRRAGRDQDVAVRTSKAEGRRGSVMGVVLKPDVKLPVKVNIALADVGGPSAGTMFALGIIDQLTPGAMTGGKQIAGTGAIRMDGEVEAISGVPQKMAGAYADGARYFLVPRQNCADTNGAIPKGMRVVRIDTLTDARAAVESIGKGKVDALPTCSTK